jgi:hypothetical protein
LLPLILSGFTHLWNPIDFPLPHVDESIYLGRAISFMDTFNPKDPSFGYDHPYFGQIFLAGFFTITGYQNLFDSTEYLNYEMIFLVPRIFMGILAVIDTFLIFKIGELRYDRKVGFIASILFAVMPITYFTRWIHLDSLQLPLTLLSVLFAILCFSRRIENARVDNKDIILVLLSGTFLGLSIFTKIPSFTMIPLVGYLVFTQSRRNFKILGLWLIPVLLIPMMWPLHSIIVGEFNEWRDGINAQTHRDPRPLYISLNLWLSYHPYLLIFGIVGMIYAVIKKDWFLMLGTIPFLIFMFFINRVLSFHLLWLIVILCLSTSRFFVGIIGYVSKISKDNLLRRLTLGGILAVLVFGIAYGFMSTIYLITQDEGSQYFSAAMFIDRYLKDNNLIQIDSDTPANKNITVISDPFFGWVQKYKFHNNNYIPHIIVPKKLMINTEKVVSIIDTNFRDEIEAGGDIGIRLGKLLSAFDTKTLATFRSDISEHYNIDVLLNDLERPNKTATEVINILDEANNWKKSKYMDIQRGLGTLNLTAHTNNTTKDYNINTAFLKTPLNLTKGPTLLSIGYLTKSEDTNTDFVIEIRDKNNTELWKSLLKHTNGIFQPELLSLGKDISDKQIKLDVKILTKEKGLHKIAFNNFLLIK